MAENIDSLISRQDAIDAIRDMQAFEDDNGQSYLYLDDVMAVFTDEEELPPAEPKMGKWVDDGDPLMLTCGNCGYGVMRYNATPFCQKCGEKKEVTE